MKIPIGSSGQKVQVPIYDPAQKKQVLVAGVVELVDVPPSALQSIRVVVRTSVSSTWSGPESVVYPPGKKGWRMWKMSRSLRAQKRASILEREARDKLSAAKGCRDYSGAWWEEAVAGLSKKAVEALVKQVMS